ncbi:MAG: flagellar protein FlgN [Cellvibrionaceae bacterium]|nr:flagellar protein FlgN [Cellvibrionaceae bacterium]
MAQITAGSIEQQINEDIKACQALLKLLDQEQQALKTRDADVLDTIIKDKAIHLSQLEQSAATRQHWSQTQGVAPNAEAWTHMLNQQQGSKLAEKWQQLKQLLQNCREINEINGKLLTRSEEIFTRVSGILRGQNQRVSLYGSSGRTTSGSNSQKMGEA